MTYNKEAAAVAAAIKDLAASQEKLDNFESYLSTHFKEWLEKYANTPCDFAAEIKSFSEMDI